MMTINKLSNVSLESIKFNANKLVLAKVSQREVSGQLQTNISYIEVCDIADTKEVTLVQSLLRYCLAEFKLCNEIDNTAKDSGIKTRKELSQFLRTKVIFKSNSEGVITKALVSEKQLKDTALNIKPFHRLATVEKENLRAALFQHANVILAQCKYYSSLEKEAKSILDLCKEAKEVKVTKAQKAA